MNLLWWRKRKPRIDDVQVSSPVILPWPDHEDYDEPDTHPNPYALVASDHVLDRLESPGYAEDDLADSFIISGLMDDVPTKNLIMATLWIAGSDGMTSDEIETKYGLSHGTVSGRLRELELDGKVCRDGLRRETRSGRTAAVYTAA